MAAIGRPSDIEGMYYKQLLEAKRLDQPREQITLLEKISVIYQERKELIR